MYFCVLLEKESFSLKLSVGFKRLPGLCAWELRLVCFTQAPNANKEEVLRLSHDDG